MGVDHNESEEALETEVIEESSHLQGFPAGIVPESLAKSWESSLHGSGGWGKDIHCEICPEDSIQPSTTFQRERLYQNFNQPGERRLLLLKSLQSSHLNKEWGEQRTCLKVTAQYIYPPKDLIRIKDCLLSFPPHLQPPSLQHNYSGL